jgi:hypothetical protein
MAYFSYPTWRILLDAHDTLGPDQAGRLDRPFQCVHRDHMRRVWIWVFPIQPYQGVYGRLTAR